MVNFVIMAICFTDEWLCNGDYRRYKRTEGFEWTFALHRARLGYIRDKGVVVCCLLQREVEEFRNKLLATKIPVMEQLVRSQEG